MRAALPSVRSLVALLVGALALAACGLRPDAPADEAARRPAAPRPVPSHPDSLLARLTPGALDYAFSDGAARAGVYTLDALNETGAVVGRFRLDRGAVTESQGTLADTSGLRVSGPVNPLGLVLPAEPPYADPRVRDRYERRRLATTWPHGAAAEAVLRLAPDGTADGVQAVRRAVVVVDTTTGRVLGAEVWRRSRSLLYDEDVHASAVVGATGGRVGPRRVRVETGVDTPGAPPRRLVQTWTAVR